jgi:hypothetical protein
LAKALEPVRLLSLLSGKPLRIRSLGDVSVVANILIAAAMRLFQKASRLR